LRSDTHDTLQSIAHEHSHAIEDLKSLCQSVDSAKLKELVAQSSLVYEKLAKTDHILHLKLHPILAKRLSVILETQQDYLSNFLKDWKDQQQDDHKWMHTQIAVAVKNSLCNLSPDLFQQHVNSVSEIKKYVKTTQKATILKLQSELKVHKDAIDGLKQDLHQLTLLLTPNEVPQPTRWWKKFKFWT
jgi:vacuolar-type H+-ATPase catalytic subunit A/Vma1